MTAGAKAPSELTRGALDARVRRATPNQLAVLAQSHAAVAIETLVYIATKGTIKFGPCRCSYGHTGSRLWAAGASCGGPCRAHRPHRADR